MVLYLTEGLTKTWTNYKVLGPGTCTICFKSADNFFEVSAPKTDTGYRTFKIAPPSDSAGEYQYLFTINDGTDIREVERGYATVMPDFCTSDTTSLPEEEILENVIVALKDPNAMPLKVASTEHNGITLERRNPLELLKLKSELEKIIARKKAERFGNKINKNIILQMD